MSELQKWYLHVDLDAFFASVEMLDHPEYRGKPVIVGGKPGDKRSVVSTASYEARKFGVHSAMPTFMAYRLCPQGIFVHPRMQRYSELSYQIMNIFRDYSPDVNQMSIDEAFIDITGTEKLFGSPLETATKIKERVKAETGLTVSVGIAPTQYLAKIASEINKPNGLYIVEPGKEESFMLSLPAKKIFGAGKKTQELLKRNGIITCRDIHEKSLETLQFLCGKNTGQFLYNAVRGIDDSDFGAESKSHSISAERTFADDIYDEYTIETYIMELAHDVMFRLLRENSYSKTVMLKLRYEDFTTVTIQETTPNNILIIDDLYNTAKKLFEKKYEKQRGIRLLGLGFENIKKEAAPIQQDLFENKSAQKKQAVEKSILTLEKKHPEIKIHKARTLKTNKAVKSILLALLMLGIPLQKTNAQNSEGAAGVSLKDNQKLKNDDNLKSLFKLDFKNDNYLDFSFSGYWNAQFYGDLLFSFGNKSPFSFNAQLPVFTQEIDLSALININKNWYFNLEFLDEFSKNTYTIGYNGNKYLKNARFSNRNIIFPALYSANLFGYGPGGGENEAPGIVFHFEDYDLNKWQGDFLVRYDMTKSKNATFYGYNSVTETQLKLSNYLTGKFFVLPQTENITAIKDVYVQSIRGTYKDSNGYKYEKLNSSEYLKLSSQKLLLLQNQANPNKNNGILPRVLVTFYTRADYDTTLTAAGSYENSESYLGKIQSAFGDVKLNKYTNNFTATVENEPALVLQDSTGFLPFLFCGKYDCGIITSAEPLIISNSSKQPSKNYSAVVSDNNYEASQNNYFYEKHLYTDIVNLNAGSGDYTNPLVRYPFADKSPELYLTKDAATDLSLILRTYSPVTNFDIGKNAAGNSVQVFINGNLDIGAKYEASSGFVTLSKPVSELDKVYIVWQEDSSDFLSGALNAGAGFIYNFKPSLTSDFSLTSRIPLSPYSKYADSENTQNSFIAATTGLKYKTDTIELSDKLSAAIQTQNLTGNYMAYTQNGSQNTTYYLASNAGFETKVIPQLNGISSAPVLSKENNITVSGFTGIKDINISGYKIPLYFDTSKKAVVSEPSWASADIKLSAGNRLMTASQLQISILPGENLNDCDVYLQLGIKAQSNFEGENTAAIPTWKLNSLEEKNVTNPLDVNKKEWQIITLSLDDEQRARLINSYDARLIVVNRNTSETPQGEQTAGSIYFGPYEPLNKGCIINHSAYINSYTQQVNANASPSSQKLFFTDSYASKITWTAPQELSDNTCITAVNYFEASDFSTYKSINFDFYYDVLESKDYSGSSDLPGLCFILDEAAESVKEDGNIAVKVEINQSTAALLMQNKNWHTLTVNTLEKTVCIDEKLLAPDQYTLFINSRIIPTRQKLIINTVSDSRIITAGSFYSGNLYYSQATPYFSIQNNTYFAYKKNSTLVKIKNYDLIKNPSVELNSTQGYSINTKQTEIHSGVADGYGAAGITFAGVILKADAYLNSNFNNTDTPLVQNAGHLVKTEAPLFNFLSFEENYRNASSSFSNDKSDSVKLDFTKLKVPLSIYGYTKAKATNSTSQQNALAQLDLKIPISTWETGLNASYQISQQSPEASFNSSTNSYFTGYEGISLLQFSPGLEKASYRNQLMSGSLYLKVPVNEIKPELKYSLKGNYTSNTKKLFNDTAEFAFNFPINLKQNLITFSYSKSAGGTDTATGNTYQTDFEQLGALQQSQVWFYSTMPFYDLLSYDLQTQVFNTNSISTFYNSKYEASWKRRLSNSMKDLYLPQGISLALTRDIRTTESVNDYYQIKATVSNSFINLFGTNSLAKKYDWYKQEEYLGSVSAVLKIPYALSSKTSFLLSGYSSLLFYIADDKTLQNGFDWSFESSVDWRIRATSVYTRPGKDSIILQIPKLFNENINFTNVKLTRKDYINLEVAKINGVNKQTYEVNHSCAFKIKNTWSINAGAGLGFNYIQDSGCTLDLKYTLGATITF